MNFKKCQAMREIFMHGYIYKCDIVISNGNYMMIILDKAYELKYMCIDNVVKFGGKKNYAYFSKRKGKSPYIFFERMITQYFTYMLAGGEL